MAQQLGVSTVLPNDQSQLSSTHVEWLTAPGLAFGLKFLNCLYSLMMGPVVSVSWWQKTLETFLRTGRPARASGMVFAEQ